MQLLRHLLYDERWLVLVVMTILAAHVVGLFVILVFY